MLSYQYLIVFNPFLPRLSNNILTFTNTLIQYPIILTLSSIAPYVANMAELCKAKLLYKLISPSSFNDGNLNFTIGTFAHFTYITFRISGFFNKQSAISTTYSAISNSGGGSSVEKRKQMSISDCRNPNPFTDDPKRFRRVSATKYNILTFVYNNNTNLHKISCAKLKR